MEHQQQEQKQEEEKTWTVVRRSARHIPRYTAQFVRLNGVRRWQNDEKYRMLHDVTYRHIAHYSPHHNRIVVTVMHWREVRMPRYGHPQDRLTGRVLTQLEQDTLQRVLTNFHSVMRSGFARIECVGFGPTGSVIKVDIRVFLVRLFGRDAVVGRNQTLCLSIAMDRFVRTLYYQERAVRDFRDRDHVIAVEPDTELGQKLIRQLPL